MKYESPELTALTSAIDAIQGDGGLPKISPVGHDFLDEESAAAYADWE